MILKVEYEDPVNPFADYLTDLGAGGVFIRTDVPFAAGQKLGLFLSFPGLLDPVPVGGVVRWRRDDEVKGVGVELQSLDADVYDQLASVLPGDERTNLDAGGGPFRVLLVENNLLAHKLFQHAVKVLHTEVKKDGLVEIVSARSAEETLPRLDQKYDLAIIDSALPRMHGGELIRRLRRMTHLRDIPVIAVSTSRGDFREGMLEAGADLFLDKPYLLKQLVGTLRELLSARTPIPRRHVIVIDDSPVILEITKQVLEEIGCEVTALDDPGKFDPATDVPPHLILMDINMPQFFGDDIVTYYKDELPVEVPIYLYSDIGEKELEARAKACGADGFIAKQWGAEGVASVVKRLFAEN